MSNDQKIPTGRLGRLMRLAGAGARAGTNMLLGGDAESSAKKTAATLSQMRALAAKVGQMAAYVDGAIPDAQRDAYEGSMKALMEGTATSDPAAIRAEIEAQLGQSMDALFLEWDDAPVASASIGQVHRARLHDGRAVAVKVQHPGVADAVEQDLKNASLLEGLAATMGARKFDSKTMVKELQERFREELDYSLEAANQAKFREFWHGDDSVVIPEPIATHCTRGVLTTEWAEGIGFETACQADEATRAAWCGTLWRFVYKSTLIGGMFNADPHPGNYKFLPDGRVIFLDFGCVQPASEQRCARALAVHRAACARDEEAFKEAARVLMQLRGGAWEARALGYMRHSFEPQFASPFRITREYSSSVVEYLREITLQTRRDTDDNFVPLQDGMLFINRLQFGFFSVLARLDATVDYNAIERGYVGPL
jgi:predicted unusual protein kinase regulating ubiquinone biosynthesis (AarF/ABC1/UbiB family)